MWTPEHRLAARRVGQRFDGDLTDEEWALVEPLIPPPERGGGKRTVNDTHLALLPHVYPRLPNERHRMFNCTLIGYPKNDTAFMPWHERRTSTVWRPPLTQTNHLSPLFPTATKESVCVVSARSQGKT